MKTRLRRVIAVSLCVFVIEAVPDAVGLRGTLASAQTSERALRLLPREAAFIGFVNVRVFMSSPLGEQLRQWLPSQDDSRRKFEAETGVNIERDIDHIVAFLAPVIPGGQPPTGVLFASGRFDPSKIEALMQAHGATVETYKGARLAISQRFAQMDMPGPPLDALAVAFVETGLFAIGSPDLVRGAIDRKDGGPSVMTNDPVMARVAALRDGDIWAVGHVDALGAQAPIPAVVAGQIPPIAWLSFRARLENGLEGLLTAETRDDESANNLRDLVRGIIGLGKLQNSPGQGLQTLLQSLVLGGTGRTVTLSFKAPAELFDLVLPR